MNKRIVIMIALCVTLFIVISLNSRISSDKKLNMINFSNYSKEEISAKALELGINVEFKYETNDNLEEDTFISQNIKEGEQYTSNSKLIITLSKKELKKEYTVEDYIEHNVNEMGLIPVMMYHGIHNLNNNDTSYTGGNVDEGGYNRTKEAFINDLEMYYQKGYRMIRLIDYINGNINVEIGKSPIVLTFDDGRINNMNVLGKDKNNNLIIDENSAVGILESFKKKYPDYNVTASFFLNEQLFEQKEYNEEIIRWLVENGYDVGNHTLGHVNFSSINVEQTKKCVAYMYKRLNEIVPDKYIPVVALPFGSPQTTNHPNFNYIIKGEYDGFAYDTKGILRVGWEPDLSPFHKNFNPLFIKRVRAYDNNGKEHDIEYTFNVLEKRKFVSDGDKDTITVRDDINIRQGLNKKITKY